MSQAHRRPLARVSMGQRAAGSQRWRRESRLLRPTDFEAVYRRGRRRTSEQFVVYYQPNHASYSRFGISVKKELGGAVVRNYLRRRIREILRQHLGEIAAGWDIVIHPRAELGRPKAPQASKQQASLTSAGDKPGRADFSLLGQELVGLLRSALR